MNLNLNHMSNSYFTSRTLCPVCKSDESKIVYQTKYTEDPIKTYLHRFYDPQGGVEMEYLNGEEYILRQCNTCGLIFQFSIPNDQLRSRLYEHWIDPNIYRPKSNTNPLITRPYLLAELLMLPAVLHKQPSQISLLDFGMGWSEWCRIGQILGYKITGSEINKDQLQYAKNYQIPTIDIQTLVDSSFDYINTEQVFEHLDQPFKTLQLLTKALKLGGVIKISVPDGTGILDRLTHANWLTPKKSRQSLNAIAPLEHINTYSKPTLLKLAYLCGLSLKRVNFLNYAMWILNPKTLFWALDHSPKSIVYAVYLPLYRKVFSQGLYLFFEKKAPLYSMPI